MRIWSDLRIIHAQWYGNNEVDSQRQSKQINCTLGNYKKRSAPGGIQTNSHIAF